MLVLEPGSEVMQHILRGIIDTQVKPTIYEYMTYLADFQRNMDAVY